MPVGAEDCEELVQDAVFTAARMLEGMIGHDLPGHAWRAEFPEWGWQAPHPG